MSATVTIPSGQPGPMQDGDFTSAGQPNVVTWNMKRLAPPSPLYVTVDDALVCAAATSQTNELVTIAYRLLRAADAKVVILEFTVAPTSTRTIAVNKRQLTEGFLLSVSCKAAVATTRGQTFVRLFLNPSAAGAGQPGLMMMADYVTTAMAPGYPNGRSLTPVEGAGVIRTVPATGLVAGSDWTVTVPPNTRWRVQSILAQLTTDLVAVSRIPHIEINIAGGLVYVTSGGASIAAGQSGTFSWAPGATVGSDSLPSFTAGLPDNLVLGGAFFSLIQSATSNLDAGDTWTLAEVCVEEWLDNV